MTPPAKTSWMPVTCISATIKAVALSAVLIASAGLLACGDSGLHVGQKRSGVGSVGAVGDGLVPTQPQNLDRSCDIAPYPSAQWTQCEANNNAKQSQAPAEQLSPTFQARLNAQQSANTQAWAARALADPSWLGAPSGNSAVTPAGATWGGPTVGDPFRYPGVAGPDGDDFYNNEAIVTPVIFYDSGCARLSGRVWQPKVIASGAKLPAVVVANGSVQATETLYWFAVQTLVRNGYIVLTYDPRGQGRSDFQTPTGDQGTNINPSVFWTGLVDAIDFFRSSPNTLYPNNLSCATRYPTQTTPFNPAYGVVDRERLGIAGHSLGAIGVSVVQGYGAAGADPWPGKLDNTNPVKVAVAWDGLLKPGGGLVGGAAGGGATTAANQFGIVDQGFALLIERGLPHFGVRVPSMGLSSDYGLFTAAYTMPPDAETHKSQAFDAWQTAAVPSFELTIQGSTHLDFSPGVGLPATAWCADTSTGACRGGYGVPMIQYYTLAWFDRWLKNPGEPGYADADARLLDDGGPQGAVKMSFRFHSARDYPDRNGKRQRCDDIRAGC